MLDSTLCHPTSRSEPVRARVRGYHNVTRKDPPPVPAFLHVHLCVYPFRRGCLYWSPIALHTTPAMDIGRALRCYIGLADQAILPLHLAAGLICLAAALTDAAMQYLVLGLCNSLVSNVFVIMLSGGADRRGIMFSTRASCKKYILKNALVEMTLT